MPRDRLTVLRLTTDVGLIVLFAAAYAMALDFPFRSARYPLVICAAGFMLAVANLIRDVILARQAAAPAEGAGAGRGTVVAALSLLALLPCVGLFGMALGAALWLPLMLHFQAGMSWRTALVDTAVVVAFLVLIDRTGIGALPSGLLI